MRPRLPDEADQHLNFEQLVETLDELSGDDVCVDVDVGGAESRSRFAASGPLRRGSGPGGLPTFTVGARFVLVLDATDFREAHLRMLDGHSHYVVSLSFGTARLTVADVGLAGMDYQGY
jgi:hypothetical protein